jgi:uncharacterized protein (TIGR02246 family)
MYPTPLPEKTASGHVQRDDPPSVTCSHRNTRQGFDMLAQVTYDDSYPVAAAPVIELYQWLLSAWNARDAKAYAALVHEKGTVIGFDGSQMNGSKEVESSLRRIFSHHPTAAYVAKIRDVRLLGAEVSLLVAVAGMVPPGQSDLDPSKNAIQCLTAQRDAGRWQIASFQNTPAAFHGRPEVGQQLTDELRQVLHAGVR